MDTTPTKRVTRRSTSESSPGASGSAKKVITSKTPDPPEESEEPFRQQPHDIETGVDGDDFEIDTEEPVNQKGKF